MLRPKNLLTRAEEEVGGVVITATKGPRLACNFLQNDIESLHFEPQQFRHALLSNSFQILSFSIPTASRSKPASPSHVLLSKRADRSQDSPSTVFRKPAHILYRQHRKLSLLIPRASSLRRQSSNLVSVTADDEADTPRSASRMSSRRKLV